MQVAPEELLAYHRTRVSDAAVANLALSLDRMHASGSLSAVGNGFQQLTGLEPRTCEEFFEAQAENTSSRNEFRHAT